MTRFILHCIIPFMYCISYIVYVTVFSEAVIVPGVHILDNNISVVRVGKKNYYIVEWMMS